MHGLYPIIRRVRRTLVPVEAESAEAKSVNEVSGESPNTTGGSPVLPGMKSVNEVAGATPTTTRETRVLPEKQDEPIIAIAVE